MYQQIATKFLVNGDDIMINVQWEENGKIQYENFLHESSVNDFVTDLKKRECVDIKITKDIEKVTAERIRRYNSGIKNIDNNNTVIDKAYSSFKNGFEPGVLYCFNNGLKGILCNQCRSKVSCKREENILKNAARELYKLSNGMIKI